MKFIRDLGKISLFVAFLYLPLAIYAVLDDIALMDNVQLQQSVQQFKNSATQTQFYINQGRFVEACLAMEAQVNSNSIIATQLISSEASCGINEGLINPFKSMLNPDQITSLQVSDGNIYSYYTQNQNNTQWTIAAKTNPTISVWQRIKQSPILQKAIVTDILLVIYIIFMFIFCGVLILAESIRNQYRRQGKDPAWLRAVNKIFGFIQLHDLKILKDANTALIQQTDDLEKDKELLETSLELSILNEIKNNNQKVPYTFKGTVVKVDINGFSKVIASGHSEVTQSLTQTLEIYGCELLQRYSGLFEKTVGDEIVVVFKGKNPELNAVAFARDLMSEFSKIEYAVGSENRTFTLKASLSTSDIVFNKRPSGYGFSGTALTLTTRLLDVVKMKDRNVLSILSESGAAVQSLVAVPAQTEKFEFKNMNTAEGYQIDQFLSVQQAYNSHPHLLTYFKSDSAVLFLFDRLKFEKDFEKIKLILHCLSAVKIHQTSEKVVQAWNELVESLLQQKSAVPQYEFVLAQVITLATQLIPNHMWDQRCIQTSLSIPRDIQGRVNASIVELLSNKNLVQVVLQNSETFIIPNDTSFRTRGNLLLSQGLYELNEQVFKDIIRMIQSSNELEMGTGLYTASQLIQHYKVHNPAALQTYDQYQKLVKSLNQIRHQKAEKISDRLKEMLNQTL